LVKGSLKWYVAVNTGFTLEKTNNNLMEENNLYIKDNKHHLKLTRMTTLLVTILMIGGLLTACGSSSDATTTSDSTTRTGSVSKENTSNSHKKAKITKSVKQRHTPASTKINLQRKIILTKLVNYTNSESAGPTGNYYWQNGKARLSGFSNLHAGGYRFTSDSQGRSATARAVLTYSEYQSSEGSRQGSPLDPPAWPTPNPKVAIYFHLTGRTYHGYLYNRSHSIADSLLGSKSYTSEYNFTTGTRPQNTGADQNGGMRFAEETAENYWKSHSQTNNTIDYETTPVYVGNETIPRGSIVDIHSSDNEINTEVVVINSVEGIKINYNTGSNNAKPIVSSSNNYRTQTHRSTSPTHTTAPSSINQSNSSITKQGQWSVAATNMVFLSDSNKFYSRVTNPNNYRYLSISQAQAAGGQRAARGNEYARP